MSLISAAIYCQPILSAAPALVLSGSIRGVLKNQTANYYSPALIVTGATSAVTWTLTGAPSAITVNAHTGEFGGSVRDSLTIVTTSLSNVLVGAAYADAVMSAYGAGVVTYSLTSGQMPLGIVLNADGTITGKAT